jgi:hypothetical protein
MTPQDWSRIQQGIFAGESGGDYGALFGYQNRPSGRFSGVDVTKMTVDQALDFAKPSGEYGQYVKGQVGRVATPMGAYQVIGTTLRAAKDGLGLTGAETMTPELQDRIGQWVYKTQGTGAWEGYKPMTDAQAVAAETMTALGLKPQGVLTSKNTEIQPMIAEQPQARGLLDSLGIQKRDVSAGGETALPFYQRDTFKDTAASLAQGFAAMGSMPALQKMTADTSSQRTEQKARNKTVAYLRANGRDDLADMVEKGLIGGKEAAGVMLSKPKEQFRQVSGADIGLTGEDANKQFNLSPDGKITAIGGSGPQVVVNSGDKGNNKFAELDAKTLVDVAATGMQAQRSMAQINRLASLLENIPTGATGALKVLAGNFGIKTEGLDDLQAAQALINSLVPEQRPPGSGPMSDADLELFKQSLPRIINSPNGNAIIIATMRGIAKYDAMGAEIVQRYRQGTIDQAGAFAELQARPDPFEGVDLGATAPQSTTTMTPEEAAAVLGGR